MNHRPLDAAHLLVALMLAGCGSPSATDFRAPDRSGGPSGGAPSGGGPSGGGPSGGAAPGGSGGMQQAGAGAIEPGGSGGAMPFGGSGGAPQAGASGSAGSGAGGSAGTGTGTTSFPCGGLSCVEGRQYCRHDLPPGQGQPEQFACLPFGDRCTTLDCSCLTSGPCTCSGEPGRITLVCGN